MAFMSTLKIPFKTFVAKLTIASLVLTPIGPVMAQQQTAPPQTSKPPANKPAAPAPGTTKPAAAASPQAAAPDGTWPRNYTTSSGAALTIYQPQVASWADQKVMQAYSAVSYIAKGAKEATLGTLKIEANTQVALEERLVSFTDFKILEANFPKLQRDDLKTVTAEITDAIPGNDRVIGLDRVLASIDTSVVIPKNVEGVKADPPVIFHSKTPAVLVNLDGEPIWAPIQQNDLKSAVNTNWDLFLHDPTKTYYLRNDRTWLKATDLKGPWSPAGKLPESFSKLPSDDNWKDVKANLPGRSVSAKDMPKVFVSEQPAEMILLKGEPAYVTVTGTKLMWVNNTESDLFRLGRTGSVYVLISGRWFSAPDFTGPWTFATTSLPEDFKKIPLEHERSRVLASVPGTSQAAEAVLLAQIPQTARVSKKLAAPEVAYQGGKPEFQQIQPTTVQRAVNTDKDILKVGDLYYMCFQGVWFMSKSPDGPWNVTSQVPKEIYEIPVSSPAHNVTYVTVVEDDDDDVEFATAMAFTGMMVAWGCVVWGSGYYYPPYYGWYGGYPYYYPHYPTYGYGARYNPWTGAYSRGAVAYGPYGGAGVAQRYNPRTGTYSRGAAAWGPYGSAGYAQAYNPRTGTYGQTRQGSNVYGSWGSTQVQRGDQWASTNRYTNRATGTTTRVTQGSGGGEAITRNTPGPGGGGVARTGSGDVYAGRDGNVYRKQGDSWQQYGDGGWNNVDAPDRPTPAGTARTGDRPTTGTTGTTGRTGGTTPSRPSTIDSTTRSQIDRDNRARTEGAQRTRDLGTVRSSGGASRAGSYRPSGGGRAGGGRRGR
jgi:hypothetical protein